MGGPKSSGRALSELYTLRKIEYLCTVPGGPYTRHLCTERNFRARWKELVAPVKLDEAVATTLAGKVRATLRPQDQGRLREWRSWLEEA